MLDIVTLLWIAIAVLTLAILLVSRVAQPYGRHAPATGRWGPTMDNRLGWIVQEAPSALCLSYFFFHGSLQKNAASYLFLGLFVLHYLNRTVIFPLRTRTTGKRIPVAVVAMAAGFNLVNGTLNGVWLGSVGGDYGAWYFATPRFAVGLALFLGGALINNWADTALIGLRRPGETSYRVPQGGLFRLVSCPNHLGEIIEWVGFAVLVGSLQAWSFALWTCCNLVPRALDHHRWYRQRFADYPQERRALIPFVL